jgi:hypothetical protein
MDEASFSRMTDWPTRSRVPRILSQPLGENPSPSELKAKFEVLCGLMEALLMEVETLRTAATEEATSRALRGPESSYGSAHREVAWLTHNSAGRSSGLQKLPERCFDPLDRRTRCRSSLREMVMT